MSTLKPLTILQKKAIRLITFSDFNARSSPLFFNLEILKFTDVVFLQNALFMHDFHSNVLPPVFLDFFNSVSNIHQYNTRLASKNAYYIPKLRTNYAKFNNRFTGVKIWNSIQENFKTEKRIKFKKLVKDSILNSYSDI